MHPRYSERWATYVAHLRSLDILTLTIQDIKKALRPHDWIELRSRIKEPNEIELRLSQSTENLREFGKLFNGLRLVARRIGWDGTPKGKALSSAERLEQFAYDHFGPHEYAMVNCFDADGSFRELEPNQRLFVWAVKRKSLVERYRTAFSDMLPNILEWTDTDIEDIWNVEVDADTLNRLTLKLKHMNY